MSEMLSGMDLTISVDRDKFDLRRVLTALSTQWPEALFQDADEEDVHPIREVMGEKPPDDVREFFVYKDRAAEESWEKEGWTEAQENGMVHFLVEEDAAHPDFFSVTVVVGTLAPDTIRLLAKFLEILDRATWGTGNGSAHRIDWEEDLQAAGYTLGRERFYNAVEELHHQFYPGWTADDLACHPHEALQFCDAVRRGVAMVPDHLVMKALLHRRKRSKRESS